MRRVLQWHRFERRMAISRREILAGMAAAAAGAQQQPPPPAATAAPPACRTVRACRARALRPSRAPLPPSASIRSI